MSTYKSNNLAARMGRWSANHWKTATFGWLAFVLVVFALGGMAGQLGGWRREDQPAVASINRGKAQHVAKKSAIRLGVAGIDNCVHACDHGSLHRETRFQATAMPPTSMMTSLCLTYTPEFML